MKKYIIYLLFVTLACLRSPNYLEQALEFAGDNRSEQEKVLVHYSQTPEDSLKLKAAEFLIENMPYHYTLSSTVLDSFKAHIASRIPGVTTIPCFEELSCPLTSIHYNTLRDCNDSIIQPGYQWHGAM
jgi:hypothetical protein